MSRGSDGDEISSRPSGDVHGRLVWDDDSTAIIEKLAETPVKPKKKKK